MYLQCSMGTLRYSLDGGHKLIVAVDQGIVDFYKALIPKYVDCKPQRYGAHISVVRNEVPPNLSCWGKYENKQIQFVYDLTIHEGSVYFWLNAFSTDLEYIRQELGLPISSEYTRPPDTYEKVFHITLANKK